MLNGAINFWGQVTNTRILYKSQCALASHIVSPAYRYIHRVLSHTLFGRKGSIGGVSKEQLQVLYCMHHGIKMDFTSILIKRFVSLASRAEGKIVIGGFITRIAEALGVFDQKKTNFSIVKGGSLVDQLSCLHMNLIEKVNGGIQVKPFGEVARALPVHDEQPLLDHAPSTTPVVSSSDSTMLQQLSKQVGRMEQRMDMMETRTANLHFKMDAYFAYLGFTPPPRP